MLFNLTTFIFELINFLVLLWLLQRIVFRPLRRGIDERRKAAQERESALVARDRDLTERAVELDARAAQIDRLRDDAIRGAAEAAAEERARILEQAMEAASADRHRVTRLLEAERDAAIAEIRELAIEQSTELTGRLLMQLAPTAVDDPLTELLIKELHSRRLELRAAAAGTQDVAVEITWARHPTDSQRKRVTDALQATLAATIVEHHAENADLQAGLRVGLCNQIFDASVAGHLAVLRDRARELAKVEQSVG